MYINQDIENIILAKTIDGSIVILNAPKSFLNEVQKNEIVVLDPNNWIKNGVFRAILLFSKFAYNNISKIDIFYFNISFAVQLIEGFQVFKEENIKNQTMEVKNELKEEKVKQSEISEVDVSKIEIGRIYNEITSFEPKKKSKCGYSQLNKEQVIEIKKLLILGELPNKKIAEMYNVSKTCISDIKVGNTYKDIIIEKEKIFCAPEIKTSMISLQPITEISASEVDIFKNKKVHDDIMLNLIDISEDNVSEKNTVSKFSPKLDIEKVKEIKRLLTTTNLSFKEIGRIFNVSDSSIYDIKKGRSWRHVL